MPDLPSTPGRRGMGAQRNAPIPAALKGQPPRPAAPAATAPTATPSSPAAEHGTGSGYGNRVRMGIIFLPEEVAGYITQAAEMDQEDESAWISRILYQAAAARVNYRPPVIDQADEQGNDDQTT